jgi:acetyl-CoA carboxylase biotin carboxyl carrier protein
VELKDIKAIIDLMKKNSITEFELEQQDSKIKLKRGLNAPIVQQDDFVSSVPVSMPSSVSAPVAQISAPQPAATGEIEIKSPMIGTFYRAPSPESANYVEVGTEVNSETVVSIIEAMKVMNEIKAEVKGVITHVLVESGKPVEFGQPLFKVRPS